MDLVGTCPKGFWEEWISEGNCAGDPERADIEYYWFTRSKLTLKLQPGDRFYVVCNGSLRGWAPVVRILTDIQNDKQYFAIARSCGAVACTILQNIPGFRGLRKRWWEREEELPFPDWRKL
jgi:hypothetical protein